MSDSTIRLPPFKVLAAALRRTTERLACELADPTDTEPAWNEMEWAVARSAAAMQGISTLLANNLVWAGPPAWLAFLAEQREQSVLRHERIGSLLANLDSAMSDAGVACVALKGAALRALDLYRPGERPMGDVDLLVASADLQRVAAAMAKINYVEAFTIQRHRVYEARQKSAARGFGEHADNPLKAEIHTAVAEQLPVRSVDITEVLMRRGMRPGLNNYPDLVSLLLHLLLHAAGNMRAHALRHIQLHDIALVASLMYENDWDTLFGQPRDRERRWWVFPPLALTARYYPGHVPPAVLSATRAACPRILRLAVARQSLTDVSWSNLRIHALPGPSGRDRRSTRCASWLAAWRRAGARWRKSRPRDVTSRSSMACPGTAFRRAAASFAGCSRGRRVSRRSSRFGQPSRAWPSVRRRRPIDRRRFCRLLRTLDIATVCDWARWAANDALRFRRMLPSAAILALEPNPRNFALMAADGGPRRSDIRIRPVAASDRCGEAPFQAPARVSHPRSALAPL
jgi:hypothetical protein